MFCARQSTTGEDVHNGVLFVTEFNNYVAGPNVFAVNVATQEEIWRADTQDAGSPNKAVYDNGVVYVGSNTFFGAFDAFTGALIWKLNDNNFGWITQPLILDDIIIVPSKGCIVSGYA